jgi:hypothetical protein
MSIPQIKRAAGIIFGAITFIVLDSGLKQHLN